MPDESPSVFNAYQLDWLNREIRAIHDRIDQMLGLVPARDAVAAVGGVVAASNALRAQQLAGLSSGQQIEHMSDAKLEELTRPSWAAAASEVQQAQRDAMPPATPEATRPLTEPRSAPEATDPA